MKKLTLLITLAGILCLKTAFATEPAVAVTNFQPDRYLGLWYEIAKLPNWFERKCVAPISATYTKSPKNPNQLIVSNSCATVEHKLNTTTGIASFVESSNIAKLKVTFLPKILRWLPIGYGDYWVLSVDYNKVAIVGSPDHKYLWILARGRKLTQVEVEAATQIAQQQGFDTTKLMVN